MVDFILTIVVSICLVVLIVGFVVTGIYEQKKEDCEMDKDMLDFVYKGKSYKVLFTEGEKLAWFKIYEPIKVKNKYVLIYRAPSFKLDYEKGEEYFLGQEWYDEKNGLSNRNITEVVKKGNYFLYKLHLAFLEMEIALEEEILKKENLEKLKQGGVIKE